MKDIDLVTALSVKMDMSPQEIDRILSELYSLMEETLINGGSVNIPGLGQFETKKKSERISLNPSNGKKYLIPPKLMPVYKPAAQWKAYLKNLDKNE